MWALVKNQNEEKTYSKPISTTINSIHYPKEMFTLYNVAEQKAIGIYSVTLKSRPDSELYNIGSSSYTYNAGTDTVNENFTSTERNLADLKTEWVKMVRTQSMNKIIHYDWLVTRYVFDNSKTIPNSVKTYLTAVRNHSDTICTAINNCSDFNAFTVVYAKIGRGGVYYNAWPDDSAVKSYER